MIILLLLIFSAQFVYTAYIFISHREKEGQKRLWILKENRPSLGFLKLQSMIIVFSTFHVLFYSFLVATTAVANRELATYLSILEDGQRLYEN